MPAARRSSATTSRSPAFTRWLSRLSLIIGLAAGLHALDTVRAQTPGSLDTGFAATTDGGGVSLAVQPDGKVLLDGKFTQVNGEAHFSIARLNDSASASFFTGEVALSNGVSYLAFPGNGNVFGYYGYFSDPA